MKFIRRKRNLLLHLNMAFVGGGCAIYAIMLRGNFGQAQTANLTDLVIRVILGDNWFEVFYRFMAFLLFMTALAISHAMKWFLKPVRVEMICFLVEFACIMIAGLLPAEIPDMMGLWPIFFMTGFQWGVFAGAEGFNCSTIFCSNNCKQALFGWMDYFADHKRRSFEQGRFYTATVIFFYCGAVYLGILTHWLGIRSFFFQIFPLASAVSLWVLTGSQKTAEKKPFTEGPQNYRKGVSEL
ncbi:MAG: YoaK family protein [Lachnospiraceae bacterium]|nr:YoaK family protein [Lachnospiraceae bacterium]